MGGSRQCYYHMHADLLVPEKKHLYSDVLLLVCNLFISSSNAKHCIYLECFYHKENHCLSKFVQLLICIASLGKQWIPKPITSPDDDANLDFYVHVYQHDVIKLVVSFTCITDFAYIDTICWTSWCLKCCPLNRFGTMVAYSHREIYCTPQTFIYRRWQLLKWVCIGCESAIYGDASAYRDSGDKLSELGFLGLYTCHSDLQRALSVCCILFNLIVLRIQQDNPKLHQNLKLWNWNLIAGAQIDNSLVEYST